MVDRLLGDLPRRISDQFSLPRGDEDVNVLRYGLENVPEELGGEEESAAEEQNQDEVNMSNWDASRIGPEGLDGASFLQEDPYVRRDRGDRGGLTPRVPVPPPRVPPPAQQGAVRRTTTSTAPKSAQAAKFVRDVDVPDNEMLEGQVVLRREDYGEPGSSEYRKNMQMATYALAEKFGVAKHIYYCWS